MSTEFVTGWHDEDYVYLAERIDDKVKVRTFPAKWSLFLRGADEEDRNVLAREPMITGVTVDGDYTRVDCRGRWPRKDVVKLLTDAGIDVLEGDVSPLARLMADAGEYQVSTELKFGYFDLETDSRETFDSAKDGNAAILSWALCDSEGNHWEDVLDEDTEDAEYELVERFLKLAEQFDVLLAWNGDGFDFPVLQSRMEHLGFNIKLSNRWNLLDALSVYKKYNIQSEGGGEQKSSYKLGHVAQYLLGEGKDDFDASKTWEAWEAGGEERERLLKYNVKDTALLPRIEEATGYLALHMAVCQICRIFPDSRSLNATLMGDGFLLALGVETGYHWPSKFYGDDIPKKFLGAYVMEPTRLGAIDNVHVADFAGLYPSIMRTFNMSLDTKVDSKHEGEKCKLPGRNTYFRTNEQGMVPMALDRLVAKRGEYQKLLAQAKPGTEEWKRYKQLSSAFKIIANSFYGIVGSPFSRFFDAEVAEGVTQTGKWLLMKVIEESEKVGLDPFYGDTDSVFVAGDLNKFQLVVDGLNEAWPKIAEEQGTAGRCHIKLELEKSFTRLVMLSKKRYAASLAGYKGQAATDAAREIKGLEYKRGDTIIMARNMQSELIESLLTSETIPRADQLWKMVRKHQDIVLKGELALTTVTLSKSLSKPIEAYGRFTTKNCTKVKDKVKCDFNFGSTDIKGVKHCPVCKTPRKIASPPAHVRVASMMREKGEPIQEGARVFYVITKNPDAKDKKVYPVPANWPEVMDNIDRDYYWKKQVYPPTQRILEAVYPEEPWKDALKAL